MVTGLDEKLEPDTDLVLLALGGCLCSLEVGSTSPKLTRFEVCDAVEILEFGLERRRFMRDNEM